MPINNNDSNLPSALLSQINLGKIPQIQKTQKKTPPTITQELKTKVGNLGTAIHSFDPELVRKAISSFTEEQLPKIKNATFIIGEQKLKSPLHLLAKAAIEELNSPDKNYTNIDIEPGKVDDSFKLTEKTKDKFLNARLMALSNSDPDAVENQLKANILDIALQLFNVGLYDFETKDGENASKIARQNENYFAAQLLKPEQLKVLAGIEKMDDLGELEFGKFMLQEGLQEGGSLRFVNPETKLDALDRLLQIYQQNKPDAFSYGTDIEEYKQDLNEHKVDFITTIGHGLKSLKNEFELDSPNQETAISDFKNYLEKTVNFAYQHLKIEADDQILKMINDYKKLLQ